MVLSSHLFGGFLSKLSTNVVFGTGSGYFINDAATKEMLSYKNKFMFVRGPLTANIAKCKYITDPAILLKLCDNLEMEKPNFITFTNHHAASKDMNRIKEVLERENQSFTCFGIGDSYESIIHKLKNTKLLMTCSLHAAIIADLMGIPWIPLNYKSQENLNYFKWTDWAYSLNISNFNFRSPSDNFIRSINDEKAFISDFKKILDESKPYLSNRSVLIPKIDEMHNEINELVKWFDLL